MSRICRAAVLGLLVLLPAGCARRPAPAPERSVTEPDVAVVPGRQTDYLTSHPAAAHLVVDP